MPLDVVDDSEPGGLDCCEGGVGGGGDGNSGVIVVFGLAIRAVTIKHEGGA